MQVFVVDEHKYREFEPMNEMLVKRDGIKMHPEPKYMICGLPAEEEYFMKLRIEMVDELRYIYQNDQWIPVASANKNAKLCKFSPIESRKEKGSLWNNIIVQFEKLRVTRDLNEIRQNVVYLEPNHKYVPILSIVNVLTGVSVDFRCDQMQFIAVKSFQSIHIRHAKRSIRSFSILDLNASNPDEVEEIKPNTMMIPNLIPNNSFQMCQLYPSYGYPNGIEVPRVQYHPYQIDYLRYCQQLQYSIHPQMQYSIPVVSHPIQYSQPTNEFIPYSNPREIKEYIPQYGWNSILVPGVKDDDQIYNYWSFRHEIWTPKERELEMLYNQTEKNYHPLGTN